METAAVTAVIDEADAINASSLAKSLIEWPSDALSAAKKANFLGKIMSKWSQIEPVAAANFMDASPLVGREVVGAKRNVAENWAAVDPQAAVTWAQGQRDIRDTRVMMSGVVAGWWQKDQEAAEAYVASNADALGPMAVATVAHRLFSQDPQRAKEWVNALPSGETRRSLDSILARQLASTDPQGASEWAASLPDDVRGSAITGAVNAWTQRDPQAAAHWLSGLSGPRRDEAIAAYGSSVSSQDPAAGLNWIMSISDDKLRDKSIQTIANGWLRRSPSDAIDWIKKSSLPDAQKAQLLATVPGRK